jgi:phospholipase D1/2
MRWFHESPKEEKPAMDFPTPSAPAHDATKSYAGDEKEENTAGFSSDPEPKSTSTSFFRRPKRGVSTNESVVETPPTAKRLRRAFSVPHRTHAKTDGTQMDKGVTTGTAKWAKLRALLPHIVHPQESILPGPSAVTSNAVNITDELITGGLSTLMLRLWFERDEKGHRRIPALFHRLRIRVSDSLHPLHRQASVFRIECEYANGAARWVVYRELRDFISLHAHYTVSNVYNRNVDKMPEFPKTSLPYFKFLKEKGDRVGNADFARLQREALENYLIELIRAVVCHFLF